MQDTLFGTHNYLTSAASPKGYMLLGVLRIYLEVVMYASMPLLVDGSTMSDGIRVLHELGKALKV